MGDYAVRMQFDIDADADAVLAMLTGADEVEQWWSRPVEGEPGRDGGQFTVSFPGQPQPFAFAVEREGRSVAWRTLAYPPWWAGTTVRWSVEDAADGDGCRLLFSHEGFDPADEIIPVITPAWAQFIAGLTERVEKVA